MGSALLVSKVTTSPGHSRGLLGPQMEGVGGEGCKYQDTSI